VNENLLKAAVKIKNSHEGKVFLEWLDMEEGSNYLSFLNAPSGTLQEFQGAGNFIYKLKDLFNKADEKLKVLENKTIAFNNNDAY